MRIGALAGWLAAGLLGLAQESPDKPNANSSAPSAIEELRGRLVCLPEEMHRLYGADLPGEHAHILGLRTEDGHCYTLIRTKLSSALFDDKRLMDRDLVLRGRVYPSTSILDVTLIRTLRNGVLHDWYYWCDICAIKSVVPDECMCCRQPVVLVEKPVEEKGTVSDPTSTNSDPVTPDAD